MSTILAIALLHGAALILICRTSRAERMSERLAKWRAHNNAIR